MPIRLAILKDCISGIPSSGIVLQILHLSPKAKSKIIFSKKTSNNAISRISYRDR